MKKITANSVTWFLGQIMTKISGLVLVIVAAKIMGEEVFGKYTIVMAYYVIFNVVIDFGLRPLTIREVARDSELSNRYLCGASLIKIGIYFVGIVILVAILLITNTPRETFYSTILAILALLPFSLSQTVSSLYMAMERMYYEAIIVSIQQIIWVATVIVLLLLGFGLIALFKALILVNIATLLLNVIIYSSKFRRFRFEFDRRLVTAMFREAIPFALTSAFAILYFRIDTLMLSWFKDEYEVAWYGVAYRFTDAVNFLPIALMVSVYPIVSRLFLSDLRAVRIIVERSYYYLFVLGLPVSAGLALSSEKLIVLFFHGNYQPSIPALAVLSWSLLPLFLNSILITTMNSANRQNMVTRATIISLVFNIIGNAIVIPFTGFYGACLTTILSEIIILVLLKREVSALLGARIGSDSPVFSPLFATFSMIMVYLFLSEQSLFLLIPLSMIVYSAVLIITGGTSFSDLMLFKTALTEKKVGTDALDNHRNV